MGYTSLHFAFFKYIYFLQKIDIFMSENSLLQKKKKKKKKK
jgi:hypothetical protein